MRVIPLQLLIPMLLIVSCVLGATIQDIHRQGIRAALLDFDNLKIDLGPNPNLNLNLTFWDKFLVFFVFGVSIVTLIILVKFPPQLEEVGK